MSTGGQEKYKLVVRELSDRLVEIQRPIRILDAVKWDVSVQEAFFAADCRELPQVDAGYYDRANPLGYDPEEKRQQFADLERDIQRQLGTVNPVGLLMRRMCREYDMVVRMLEARGQSQFGALSEQLYGGADDAFHAGDPTLADLGALLAENLDLIDAHSTTTTDEKTMTGEETAPLLQARLRAAFPDADPPVRVVLSDGIVSDAAAGADYLKIRREARFSQRDLRLLELHEGWVHVGTTLNGRAQSVCTFLSKGPPSATVTQEGLAILMEVLAFASYPARVRKLANRIRAVAMAAEGATFLDVFDMLRGAGYPDLDSYTNAARVFRGSTPDGPPFTKDLCYSKGFVMTYNFLQLAVRKGKLEYVPLLFCGKTTLEDLRTLAQLAEEGLVEPPRQLPPQFADPQALLAWMCYSNFLGRLNLDQVEVDYAGLL